MLLLCAPCTHAPAKSHPRSLVREERLKLVTGNRTTPHCQRKGVGGGREGGGREVYVQSRLLKRTILVARAQTAPQGAGRVQGRSGIIEWMLDGADRIAFMAA